MESLSANNLPEDLRPHWEAIQKQFEGILLYIPVRDPETAPKTTRNRQIYADHLGGVSIAALMQRYGLSRTRVYKIISDCKEGL